MNDLFANPVVDALLAGLFGIALGFLHFASLRRVTELYLSGVAVSRAVALQLLRLAVLGVGLAGLAKLGALPLLAGALGVLLARQAVIRRVKKGA